MGNSLPTDFLSRLKNLFPDNFEEVKDTFLSKRSTTFRVNNLKSSSKEVKEKLTKLNFETEEVSWYKDAFILKNKTQRELTETESYKNGEIYLQNLSSMLPTLFLKASQKETVLDICAAPGSKTTQIAADMNNTGQIVANDMSKVRLYKLSANLKTLGVTNVKTTHFRAQEMWRMFPNVFDKTLVDVPCSLEGRFLESNPKTYKDWSVKKVKKLSEYQKQILHSAISCTKPGGTIIYSTCTLSPEENEGVIDWVLKKHGDLVRLEELVLPKEINTANPVMSWNDKSFTNEVSKTKRVIPSSKMEAFFIAKLTKL